MSFLRRFFSSTNSNFNMAEAKTKAQDLIDKDSVVVFSKSWCSFSAATKKALDKLQANYALYELDEMADGSELQAALEEISGQRTVPNVFISQKHIGGNSDLQALVGGGKLENLLKGAGALKA